MYIPHIHRVCMEVGRISPSLCPQGTSIPAPCAGKRETVLKSAVLGFRLPRSAGRTYGKKKTGNSGFSPPLLILVSFPNPPLLSSKCCSVHSAWWFRLSFRRKQHGVCNPHQDLGGCHMITFSVDTTKLWKEISDLYHYVNYGLLGTQKSQFLVKIKTFSSISNEWLRN